MAIEKRTFHSTAYRGVRYKTIEGRRYGVQLDRYFVIRFRVNGKNHQEGLGWSSQGWTAEKAALKLAELKENQRTGKGPLTLAEARAGKAAELEAQRRAERQAEEEARKAEALIYNRVFEDYLARNTHLKDL